MNSRAFFFLFGASLILHFGCESPSSSTLEDIEKNQYQIINIGDQSWMERNLMTVLDPSGQAVKVFWPAEDSTTAYSFGALYDFETACTICPIGWHLPDMEEWKKLDHQLRDEGIRVKDKNFWQEKEGPSFMIRPAGYGTEGEYNDLFMERAILWTSTSTAEGEAMAAVVERGSDTIRFAPQHMEYGFSVRCIKD